MEEQRPNPQQLLQNIRKQQDLTKQGKLKIFFGYAAGVGKTYAMLKACLLYTSISAGVKVGVGGHEEEKKGDEQFEISDPRSVDEVRRSLFDKGLQPVFTDYVRV